MQPVGSPPHLREVVNEMVNEKTVTTQPFATSFPYQGGHWRSQEEGQPHSSALASQPRKGNTPSPEDEKADGMERSSSLISPSSASAKKVRRSLGASHPQAPGHLDQGRTNHHQPRRLASFPKGDSFQSPGLRRTPLPRDNPPHHTLYPNGVSYVRAAPPFTPPHTPNSCDQRSSRPFASHTPPKT